MIKQGNPVTLSKRLKTIADMIPEGGVLADVGCDHGFLDIYLVQTGKIPGAIAMDVRTGPLAAATAHVKEAGLENKIETRLSDGLGAMLPGEAKTLVCAGMGGPLMQRILRAYPEKTESFQDLLLQPQSEIPEFRSFLRESGYKMIEERIVWEDGKYYFPMRVRKEGSRKDAEPGALEVFDQYGEGLLRNGDPLMKKYLLERGKVLDEILEKLGSEGEGNERRDQRLHEVNHELEILKKALEMMA